MQQSQEMQAVHQQLQETIQTLHRKAVDADQILDNLQRDQKMQAHNVVSASDESHNARRVLALG